MPLYALPITAASHPASSSLALQFQLPSRKRKRRRNSSTSSSEEEQDVPISRSSSLPAALTNPLSLAPDEVVQYRLAGLELDQQLPSTKVKDFPHRGFPVHPLSALEAPLKGNGKSRSPSSSRDVFAFPGTLDEAREEDEPRKKAAVDEKPNKKSRDRGPMLRMQHLAVLTAILQRCLQEGDIPRAGKAWALLIRAEVGGKGIDLRGSGYWGIGAELLIRFQEKAAQRSSESGSEDEDGSDDQSRSGSLGDGQVTAEEESGGVRWGTAEGFEKAKNYYERLIVQYPYKRQFPGSVSALDFWPAMVGCEIYGIQYEQKEALRKLAVSHDNNPDGAPRSGKYSDEAVFGRREDEEDDMLAAWARRRATSAENEWQQREAIRNAALTASVKVADRLDALMTTPPYLDSHSLLRLRGMLALYIGDLSVPSAPIVGKSEDENADDGEVSDWNMGSRHEGPHSKKRLLFRQRMQEHERGKKKKADECVRARRLFERIEAAGGRADYEFRQLGGGAEDLYEKGDEEHPYGYDMERGDEGDLYGMED